MPGVDTLASSGYASVRFLSHVLGDVLSSPLSDALNARIVSLSRLPILLGRLRLRASIGRPYSFPGEIEGYVSRSRGRERERDSLKMAKREFKEDKSRVSAILAVSGKSVEVLLVFVAITEARLQWQGMAVLSAGSLRLGWSCGWRG